MKTVTTIIMALMLIGTVLVKGQSIPDPVKIKEIKQMFVHASGEWELDKDASDFSNSEYELIEDHHLITTFKDSLGQKIEIERKTKIPNGQVVDLTFTAFVSYDPWSNKMVSYGYYHDKGVGSGVMSGKYMGNNVILLGLEDEKISTVQESKLGQDQFTDSFIHVSKENMKVNTGKAVYKRK